MPATRIRILFFGFHSHINSVFGQIERWFKAQYTTIGKREISLGIGMFIHLKYNTRPREAY